MTFMDQDNCIAKLTNLGYVQQRWLLEDGQVLYASWSDDEGELCTAIDTLENAVWEMYQDAGNGFEVEVWDATILGPKPPVPQTCGECGSNRDGSTCAGCGSHICNACDVCLYQDEHYCEKCREKHSLGRCEGCSQWFKQNDLVYEDGNALCGACDKEIQE